MADNTNKYDDLLSSMAQPETAQAARVGMSAAADTNPDAYAEAQRVAKSTGVPVDTVFALPQEMKRQAAVGAVNFDNLAKVAPATAGLLADVEKAKIAHDDIDNTANLEQTLGVFKNSGKALASGVFGFSEGVAGQGEAAADIVSKSVTGPMADMGILPVDIGAPVAQAFHSIRQNQRDWRQFLTPQAESNLGAGFYSGLQSLTQNTLTLPLALMTDNPNLALQTMAGITGGQSYGKARDKGLGVPQSALYGAADAAIEYGTEMTGMNVLFKDLKVGTPLAQSLMHQVIPELAGEQAATVLQDFNEFSSLPNDNTFQDYLNQRPDAAVQTAIATLVGQGGMVSIAKAADSVVNKANRGKQNAELHVQALEQINQLSQASKVMKRDPDTMKGFVDQVIKNSTNQNVYIDAKAYAQSGVANEVNSLVPEVAAQLPEALATGGEVRIPVSDYVTKIAPTEYAQALLDHIRLPDEDFSRAGAEEYMNNHSAEIQAEVEKVLLNQQDDINKAISQETVKQSIKAQLSAVSQFPDKVNDIYSTLAASAYTVQAEKFGISPETLLQQYPINISAVRFGNSYDQLEGQRGAYNPDSNTITLLENADLSTFGHELGHFFLDMQMELTSKMRGEADTFGLNPMQKQWLYDTDTLMKWFGLESPEQWHALDFEEKRRYHEKFAEGFEKYLFEGKSPSLSLSRVFANFRQWIVDVYKHLKGHFKDIELSNDVRRVFDRMLATDEEIQLAEQARSMMPLFTDEQTSGMSTEDFTDYQAQGEQATAEAKEGLALKGVRDMQWLQNARNKTLKKLQKQHDELRREVRASVRAQVMSQPVYRAWDFLTGKQGNNEGEVISGRISRSDLDAMEGISEDEKAKIISLKMTAKDGLHPDVITDIVPGFSSGDEMVRALANAEPPKQLIEKLTDQRMLQEHGELGTPDAIERSADEAIHSDARARFVTTEANALAKAVGSLRLLGDAAKEYAAQAIGRLKAKDVNPNQYARAEVRAAKAAVHAQKSGDFEVAAAEKRNQVLNIHLTREAYRAQDDAAKIARYLKKFDGNVKNVNVEYLDDIRALLEWVSFRKLSKKNIDDISSYRNWAQARLNEGQVPDISPLMLTDKARRDYIAKMQSRDEHGELVYKDDADAIKLLADAIDHGAVTPYQDMTVDALRGLYDTVRNMEYMGRLKDRYLSDKNKQLISERRLDMANVVAEHGGEGGKNVRTANDTLGRLSEGVEDYAVSHIKVPTWARIMDGGKDNGPMWRNLILPANKAADWETTRKAQAIEALDKIIRPLMAKVPIMDKMGKGKGIDSVPGLSLNWVERFAVLLNSGNESNLQRLMGGGVGAISARLSPSQVMDILSSHSVEELMAAQAIWDHFETYWPEIEEMEKRIKGIAPEKIPIRPITITAKDGQVVTLRGGYYPVVFDPKTSAQARQDAESSDLKERLQASQNSATARKSFTKERVDDVFNRPLLLNMQGLYSGVNDVIHYLAYQPWVIDANRLLRPGQPLQIAIHDYYGSSVYREFVRWKDDIVMGQRKLDHQVEKAVGFMRRNISTAALSFSVMTAAMQPLGIINSAPRVPAKWLGKGIARYLSNPKTATKQALELSEFLRNRGRTRFRDLYELRNLMTGPSHYNEMMGHYGYWLMMRAQSMVDIPTWWGAYEKALTDNPMDSDLAVHLADQAVKDSQGGGEVIDQSGIERGGALIKIFTTFYNFMGTTLNGAYLSYKVNANSTKAMRQNAKTAVDILLLTVAIPQLGLLLKNAITPSGGDDDDESLPGKMAREELSYLMGLVALGREFSSITKEGAEYKGPPGLRLIPDTFSLAHQAVQGEFDDAFRKAFIGEIGDLTGLPSRQVNDTITGAKALDEGKTHNPAALAFGFKK